MTEYNLIRIKQDTKDRLDNFKAPGQSYDGLLQQILLWLESVAPMPPHKGPPLPQFMDVKWKDMIGKRENKQ